VASMLAQRLMCLVNDVTRLGVGNDLVVAIILPVDSPELVHPPPEAGREVRPREVLEERPTLSRVPGLESDGGTELHRPRELEFEPAGE
jgi:hypothetical protein